LITAAKVKRLFDFLFQYSVILFQYLVIIPYFRNGIDKMLKNEGMREEVGVVGIPLLLRELLKIWV